MTERRQREPAERDAEDLAVPERPPLDEASLKARRSRAVAHQALVPRSRLAPALKRGLSALRAGPIDLRALARVVAERRELRRLPRRTTTRWSPEIVVVLDRSPRLWPFCADVNELAELLRAECGRDALSLRVVECPPPSSWTEWRSRTEFEAAPPPTKQAWRPPPRGARVLIVSDLGLAQRGDGELVLAWRSFADSLVNRGCRPLALVPLGANQIDTRDYAGLTVLRWSPDSRLRPERTAGRVPPGDEPGLSELLAMVAATRRTEPTLLRALRRLNPVAPFNAGLELALWSHPDVVTGSVAEIAGARAQERHMKEFRTLGAELRAKHTLARREHHAHLRAAVSHEEDWLGGVEGEWREFLERLVVTLRADGPVPAESDLRGLAGRIVERASPEMARRHRAGYYGLVREVRRWAAEEGRVIHLPGSVDPAVLAAVDPGQRSAVMRLVEGRSGAVRLREEPPDGSEREIAGRIAIDGGGLWMSLASDGEPQWFDVPRRPVELGRSSGPVNVELETSRDRLRLQTVLRPRGAAGWSRGRDGISVQTAFLGSLRGEWSHDELEFRTIEGGPERGGASIVAPSKGGPLETAGDFAVRQRDLVATLRGRVLPASRPLVAFGIDAEYGVYADVTLFTARSKVTQRFRWIEPGEFLMGSPEGEAERAEREGPRHRVVITAGFWLGDTACTQRVWEQVMGVNPSRFKGAERPVERVSWEDVQKFVAKLEQLLPGVAAGLPTEAEWEYACRAGNETPYWFGATIGPEQVNYDGNYPYGGGAKGLHRGETVEVKALPANGWGLFQMHGNIWEWCRDSARTYMGAEAVDPVGPEGPGQDRVVRGGSWDGYAGWARSAFRGADLPGVRFGTLGFRLRLRSMGSSPARPPAEQAPPARGAGSGGPEGEPGRPGFAARLLRGLTGRGEAERPTKR